MKATITQKLVTSYQKQAKAGEVPKPIEVNDTDLTGFILRIQPSGRMSYIVQLARAKRITLGDAAVLTPTQGRSKAKVALGAQADGRDPKAAIRIEEGSQVPDPADLHRRSAMPRGRRRTARPAPALVARITSLLQRRVLGYPARSDHRLEHREVAPRPPAGEAHRRHRQPGSVCSQGGACAGARLGAD